jgi:putative transcriptional regulator
VFAKNVRADLPKTEVHHMRRLGRDREELRETTALEKKTAGQRIIEVLQEAVRFSKGEPVTGAVVTQVKLPVVDIRDVRQKMKLSQTEFARRFGFAPASLRNWEQGRSEPDGPARVLLAVIARHPEAVEDALTSLRRAG